MTRDQMSGLECMESEMHQEGVAFLIRIRDEAKTYDRDEIADEEGNPSIDVRIQVLAASPDSEDYGSFKFHSGDSQYDTDGTGDWGCSSVSPEATEHDLIQTIRDMVSQALDSAAESVEG